MSYDRFGAKIERRDAGSPNSHLRVLLNMTPKQADMIVSALKAAAIHRSTERERAYMEKIIKKIREQEAV